MVVSRYWGRPWPRTTTTPAFSMHLSTTNEHAHHNQPVILTLCMMIKDAKFPSTTRGRACRGSNEANEFLRNFPKNACSNPSCVEKSFITGETDEFSACELRSLLGISYEQSSQLTLRSGQNHWIADYFTSRKLIILYIGRTRTDSKSLIYFLRSSSVLASR